MKIILLKDVDNVGYKYDEVNVKNGFGRNYLIPQKLAVIANDTNLAKLKEVTSKIEAENAARVGEFKEMADKISAAVLKIGAKAGTSGKIFGSVTNLQVVQAIKEQLGLDVERRTIHLNEDVKTLGSYTATAKLHKEVEANVSFEVVAD
ncbi:MAG: 50S ribosomal protein L9 [Saprospiraceae bacterium]